MNTFLSRLITLTEKNSELEAEIDQNMETMSTILRGILDELFSASAHRVRMKDFYLVGKDECEIKYQFNDGDTGEIRFPKSILETENPAKAFAEWKTAKEIHERKDYLENQLVSIRKQLDEMNKS